MGRRGVGWVEVWRMEMEEGVVDRYRACCFGFGAVLGDTEGVMRGGKVSETGRKL